MHSVLVVESDQFSRSATVSALQSAGYQTIQADCMDVALEIVNNLEINAALLDYELPDGSGMELISHIERSRLSRNAISIILGPCCNENARIIALQNGADDVLSKPISLNELILRLDNLFKHRNSDTSTNSNITEIYGIKMDLQSLEVTIDGQIAELSLLEFRLLYHFAKNPNKVFVRQELGKVTNGANSTLDSRSIDVYIMRLRQSLQKFGKDSLIQTVRGAGYRFSG